MRIESEEACWQAVCAHAGENFRTAKGLPYSYEVRGGELFVSRRSKTITRSTVDLAFHAAIALGGQVTGPKKLGVFGASYIYPVFVEIGVVEKGLLKEKRE